jgi:hypothetical protein
MTAPYIKYVNYIFCSVFKAFHARWVATDIDDDVVFPEVSEDPDVDTISLPKSIFQEQGILV